MEGYLTRKNIREVRDIVSSPERRWEMTETNYDIASRYYSYEVLRSQLNYLIDVL